MTRYERMHRPERDLAERPGDAAERQAAATAGVEDGARAGEEARLWRDLDQPRSMSNAANGVAGRGAALPFADRIQASFGRHDISHVRAHTGDAASDAAASIGGRAYTMGSNVAFAGTPDLHTAAHEAAHVVQQRAGVALKGIDGGAADPHEAHADAVADAVVAGRSAEPLLDRHGGGGGSSNVVQRAPAQGPQQAPGAMITVSLFDANQNFITSRSEPLFSQASEGEYTGEIDGDTVQWDSGSIDVKLGNDVAADGKLLGAMSVGAWAKKAGNGRAAYVLVEVQSAQLKPANAGADAKPWFDDVTSPQGGATKQPAKQSGANGTDPAGIGKDGGATKGSGESGSGGQDDTNHAGAITAAGHTGRSDNAEGAAGGTRKAGARGDEHGAGSGRRFGKKGAARRKVGAFWDPRHAHDGTQDTAPDHAEKGGEVGGEGKHGDQGVTDVGAWKPRIPIPARIRKVAMLAVIAYSANVQQIFKGLLGAVAKGVGEAELRAMVRSELNSLAEQALRDSAEELAALDDVAKESAKSEVRTELAMKLAADADLEISNLEKDIKVDKAHVGAADAKYAADNLGDSEQRIAAAKRVRGAVKEELNQAAADARAGASKDAKLAPEAGPAATALEVPQGLSPEKFSAAGKLIREKVPYSSGEIVVHGSRAVGAAKAASDIDFAIRVSPQEFDEIVKSRFGTPNPGSAKAKTMLHAIETGKVQAGEAGLRSLRVELETLLGMEVDISVVRIGGQFDTFPQIRVP